MNRILEIDLENERAVVQPGVVNLDITLAVQAHGYFYAPDPSSQRACTIGGNVAENAGGPHTLAYGVTTNHVLGLEVVLPDGSVVTTGGKEPDCPGYDLTGLLTGSEGTMALVTKVIVRLMRKPELVKTLLAIYDSADDCGRTVAEITARAITPVAVEMLDGVMLRMVEEATHAGYPDGRRGGAADRTRRLARDRGRAGGADPRSLPCLPRARVSRGAIGRRARSAVEGPQERIRRSGAGQPVLTTCRTAWCRARRSRPRCGSSAKSAEKYGLTISNIFHAGDGNMHPIILFDARKPGDLEKAQPRARRSWTYCISVGGSITGEHGVGMEKNELMGKLFSADTLDMIRSFKRCSIPRIGSIPARFCRQERAAWRSGSLR